MHHEYQLKDNSTFEQRAVAVVLDLTIIGLLTKILPISIFSGNILSLLYFVVLQAFFGFTPGKYFVGLRVISTTGETSALKLLFRETIGKSLSLIVFGMGYFSVMFSKSRLCWHDRMSSTRVISLKPQKVVGFSQFARGLGSLTLLLIFGLGAWGVFMLYSTDGARAFVSGLESKDFVARGVSGNLMNGVKIKEITKSDKDFTVHLNDVEILVNHKKSIFQKFNISKDITVNKIHIKSGEIEIKKPLDLESSAVALVPKDVFVSPKLKPVQSGEKNKNSRKFTGKIESFELANFTVKNQEKSFNIERASVSNLIFNKENISTKHIYIKSDLGIFYLKDFLDDKKNKAINYSVDITLKPNSFYLKKLGTSLRLLGDFTKREGFTSIKFRTHDNRFKIEKNDQNFSLSLNEFPLDEYIVGNFPVKTLSVETEGFYFRGKLRLRNKEFTFAKQPLMGNSRQSFVGISSSDKKIAISWLKLLQSRPWLSIGDNAPVQIYPRQLSSSKKPNPLSPVSLNSLAQLYTKKPYSKLSKKAKALVKKDLEFFSTSFIPSKNKD